MHRVRRTTISCRFIAPTIAALIVAYHLAGPSNATLAQAPQAPAAPAVQAVPTIPHWFVSIAAAPAVPPVTSGDRVYLALRTGPLAAHHLSNGRLLWSVDLAAEQPLAIDDSHVFVAAGEAVHALDGASGVASWRAPTGAVTAPLLVHAGWLIAASQGGIAAFRAADGTGVWRQDVGTIDERPFIDGDTLYVAISDGRMIALDLHRGTLMWERKLPAPLGEPLVAHARVYVGSGDKFFNCLDAEDGDIEWRSRVGAELRGRPAVDEARVYFAALDNELRALDRESGAIRWHRGVPFRPSAGPILIGNAVAIPGPVAELRLFEASKGAPVSGFRFTEPSVIAPALVPGEKLEQLRVAAVTGGLNNDWRLAVFGPSIEPPAPVPVLPLTELPGVALPFPM